MKSEGMGMKILFPRTCRPTVEIPKSGENAMKIPSPIGWWMSECLYHRSSADFAESSSGVSACCGGLRE